MFRHENENLVGYLDGGLAPDARARVERHLAECAACRAALDGLRAARPALERAGQAASAPAHDPELWARVRAEIAPHRPPRPRWAWGAGAFALTATAIVLLALPASRETEHRLAPSETVAALPREAAAPPEAPASPVEEKDTPDNPVTPQARPAEAPTPERPREPRLVARLDQPSGRPAAPRDDTPPAAESPALDTPPEPVADAGPAAAREAVKSTQTRAAREPAGAFGAARADAPAPDPPAVVLFERLQAPPAAPTPAPQALARPRALEAAGMGEVPTPKSSVRYVVGEEPHIEIVVPWLEDGGTLVEETPRGRVEVRLVNHNVRSPIDNATPTRQLYTFIVDSPPGIPVRFEGAFKPTALEINGKSAYEEYAGDDPYRLEWKTYRDDPDVSAVEAGSVWLPGGRNTISFAW